MTRFRMPRPAALAGLALALLAGAPLAAQEQTRAPGPPLPLFELYPSFGLSVHQTPLTTNFADVLPVALRIGVPVGNLGIEPWVGGSVAHVRTKAIPCPQGQATCSSMETRFLAGAAYRPRGLGGAYAGAGFGVRSFRSKNAFGHSLVIGFAFPAARSFEPGFELRSENYPSLGEVLIMAAVVRLSWPR